MTSSHESYDVIVLGAGIAGLLIGAELSKQARVLVLEKESAVPRSKYWLTSAESLEVNPELRPCLDRICPSMDLIAHDLTLHRCAGAFPLWNTGKLVDRLARRICERGELRLGAKFHSYRHVANGVEVFAGPATVHGRLVIDCMGHASPIVAAKSLLEVKGYYLLLNAVVPLAREFPEIALYNLALASRPSFFEAFYTSDGHAHVAIIAPSRTPVFTRPLRDDLLFALNQSSYAENFVVDEKRLSLSRGVVPVGRMRTRALDRVVFFGEAGQTNPASSSTTLTRILLCHKGFASALAALLEADRLTARDLGGIGAKSMPAFSREFQLHLFDDILRWTSDGWRELVREMSVMPPQMLVDAIFADLRLRDVLTVPVLSAMFRNRCGHFFRNGVKACLTRAARRG